MISNERNGIAETSKKLIHKKIKIVPKLPKIVKNHKNQYRFLHKLKNQLSAYCPHKKKMPPSSACYGDCFDIFGSRSPSVFTEKKFVPYQYEKTKIGTKFAKTGTKLVPSHQKNRKINFLPIASIIISILWRLFWYLWIKKPLCICREKICTKLV